MIYGGDWDYEWDKVISRSFWTELFIKKSLFVSAKSWIEVWIECYTCTWKLYRKQNLRTRNRQFVLKGIVLKKCFSGQVICQQKKSGAKLSVTLVYSD